MGGGAEDVGTAVGDGPSKGIGSVEKSGFVKDNCELNCKYLNNLLPEWKKHGTLMRQTKNLMGINTDVLINIMKQNQGEVNQLIGVKTKEVIVSDLLALVVEKKKASKGKEKIVVESHAESDAKEEMDTTHGPNMHTPYVLYFDLS
ncbi:hypothetical protein Tco_0697243 [Tanacetum coccineum]